MYAAPTPCWNQHQHRDQQSIPSLGLLLEGTGGQYDCGISVKGDKPEVALWWKTAENFDREPSKPAW
jgi:hypothetical protein